MDSFAGLFNGFYYIFIGESTSKADKFDNLRSMKILNMPLSTKKSPGIRTKRPRQEQNLQTKKGEISRPRGWVYADPMNHVKIDKGGPLHIDPLTNKSI